jgi:hypothetical protein
VSFNLLVWKWSPDFDTGAKRKKARLKYPAIVAAFLEHESHPAMAEYDFANFEAALAEQVGPEVVDGLYILERYPGARVVNIALARSDTLVPTIGMLAQRLKLTSAGM